jgi:propionyl-CoA carboxylase alpha chain
VRDVLVAVAASIDHMSNQRRRAITQQMHGEPVRFAEKRIVELGEQRVRVTVAGALDGKARVFIYGADHADRRVTLESSWWFGMPVFEGTVDGMPVAVQVRPILNGCHLTYQGVEVATRVFTERETALAAQMPEKIRPDMSKFLLCPMPGLVVSLAVSEGQEVAAGDALCVVEAMKMENVLKAERDAKVSKILAKPGDSLNVDAVILEFA